MTKTNYSVLYIRSASGVPTDHLIDATVYGDGTIVGRSLVDGELACYINCDLSAVSQLAAGAGWQHGLYVTPDPIDRQSVLL